MWESRRVNVLGLRLDWIAASSLVFAEPKEHPDPISFLDFTVDGASLGERFNGEITSLTVHDPDFRTENLRRLTGAQIPLPTFEPRFYRTRVDRLLHRRGTPHAPHETAFRTVASDCTSVLVVTSTVECYRRGSR